jgi:hypothetical protein
MRTNDLASSSKGWMFSLMLEGEYHAMPTDSESEHTRSEPREQLSVCKFRNWNFDRKYGWIRTFVFGTVESTVS